MLWIIRDRVCRCYLRDVKLSEGHRLSSITVSDSSRCITYFTILLCLLVTFSVSTFTMADPQRKTYSLIRQSPSFGKVPVPTRSDLL